MKSMAFPIEARPVTRSSDSEHRAALRRIGFAVFAARGRRLTPESHSAGCGGEAILAIPAKRPIKPVCSRKLLAMAERRGDGETREAALADVQNAIAEGRDAARQLGRDVPSPAALGQWRQRAPRSLDEKLKIIVAREGVSLSAVVTSVLAEAVARSRHNLSPTNRGIGGLRRFSCAPAEKWRAMHDDDEHYVYAIAL